MRGTLSGPKCKLIAKQADLLKPGHISPHQKNEEYV